MSHFFAYLARLRLVQRWGLMRAAESENVAEHSHQVAVVAHALAVIGNRYHGRNLDPAKVALVALFHDASEVLTGDLPTPVKYATADMRSAYKGLEAAANKRLLDMLPEGWHDAETMRLVKAADKLCAYLKAVQEVAAGNREFAQAEKALREQLKALEPEDGLVVPEVERFLHEFGHSFSLSLDDLQKTHG